VANNVVTEGAVLLVTVCGEAVAERPSCVSSAETVSRRPKFKTFGAGIIFFKF